MPSSLMDFIDSTKNHVTRLVLFNNIKTGDPLTDTILTTVILSLFSWFVSWVYDNQIDRIFSNFSFDDIKTYFFKKNTIIIEGCRSSTTSSYTFAYNISSAYSDRFKAIWNYIIDNVDNNNNTIYKIKENHTNFQTSMNGDDRRKNADLFMVYQNKHFNIDKDIYFKTNIEQDSEKNEKEKMSIKTDRITICIYSYKLSLSKLREYVENITTNYLSNIRENRLNKKFIYSLEKVEIKDEESKFDCWREDFFESARTFNNIFFDGKKHLLEKIDFFLNNKQWYYEKGIPYSLGIGLHGPPGTGKTSFIKALANYTNRHIIVLSLKLIKTKNQLERMFFENTYNDNNDNNCISWDKKILVFEDIDCIGDIILKREDKDIKKTKKIRNKKFKGNSETVKVGDIIQTICDLNDSSMTTPQKEQLITLDDILNLWDGIRETPGRILIISSNHYNKLDPALTRPGRIDITHELSNASHNTISEIYLHLFNNKINKNKLKEIKENFYSPAEIINIYVSHKDEKSFIDRLCENKKLN